jgi:hypothetical protein
MLALVVALTLVVMVVTPARAEADVLAGLAIAGLVVAGVILIAYLVIAGVDSSQRGAQEQVIWLACAGDECAEVTAEAAHRLAVGAAPSLGPATPVESP